MTQEIAIYSKVDGVREETKPAEYPEILRSCVGIGRR